MIAMLLRKLLYAFFSLFLVATLTFILMKAIPGDPFRQEQALPKEIYDALREHYGLNDSWPVQYLRYLTQLASFDLGPSFIHKGRSVSEIIKQSLPISAILGCEALCIALPLGLLLGTLSALRQNLWQDGISALLAVIGMSVPSFILATLLQYILAIKFEMLPVARWGTFSQTILPALSLAALPTAFITRLARSKMLEELRQEYIKTARAKGLPEHIVVFRHALRNTLIPVMSYLGQVSANVLTGSFIVEKIFSIPGLGYWFVMSVLNRDYTLIMGITVFYCALLLLTVFVVDVICLFLDPRISYSVRQGEVR